MGVKISRHRVIRILGQEAFTQLQALGIGKNALAAAVQQELGVVRVSSNRFTQHVAISFDHIHCKQCLSIGAGISFIVA